MKQLSALLVASLALSPLLAAQVDGVDRTEVPGELIVCFETNARPLDLQATVAEWGFSAQGDPLQDAGVRKLLQWRRRGATKITNVVLFTNLPHGSDAASLRRSLAQIEGVQWTSPNTARVGDFKELVPNDPQYGSQYHHPLMQNDGAWDITLGDSSVIIGVTDDGFDIDHEDLVQNIWINSGETPGDGIDNDGNGYIDDVNGYDFMWDNNDPNPNSASDDHGTHCIGIAAADTDNGVGVAGTAGGATIMPLQFYTGGQSWTAANVAEAFAYGVDNGARIMSMSYNLDTWVGDPTVEAAFDYVYDNGVLHFNSAGNGGALNPARQVFHQTFLVANTDSSDIRSSSSNYGTGIDLAAPGSSIYSTILNNAYGFKSGTSMASPNAAGVAALIWSANPGWTRDQVAAQLFATADNVDAQNPGLEGLLGGGRVNSLKALTLAIPAPRVAAADGLPNEGSNVLGDLADFQLRFDQIMDPAAVNDPNAFSLVYAGADDVFGTGDDSSFALTWDEYLIGGNEISFSVATPLSETGIYRFTADAAILSNPFGTGLDGDGDGTPGDSWVRQFNACAVVLLVEDFAESGTDWSVVDENLSTGSWTVPPVVPSGGGLRNDPPTDFDGSGRCFVTQDGPGDQDVDGGPTRLISRAFDLTGIPSPILSYARWHNSNGADVMTVDVSADNGANWTPVFTHTTVADWVVESFNVSDFVTPSAQMRLRFSVADLSPASITESGIDHLRVLTAQCDDPEPVGTSYCIGATNSTGVGATIRATGSHVVANNSFTLIAENAPTGVPGLFFYGPTQVQLPFGDGFRCVGGTLTRVPPPINVSGNGAAIRVLDLAAPPASGNIAAGVTTNFQFWFRDTAAGGAGFNTTDGLSVTWQ